MAPCHLDYLCPPQPSCPWASRTEGDPVQAGPPSPALLTGQHRRRPLTWASQGRLPRRGYPSGLEAPGCCTALGGDERERIVSKRIVQGSFPNLLFPTVTSFSRCHTGQRGGEKQESLALYSISIQMFTCPSTSRARRGCPLAVRSLFSARICVVFSELTFHQQFSVTCSATHTSLRGILKTPLQDRY